jgi:hypothetical protein
MIWVQEARSVACWPLDEVASLAPEFEGRWRVVRSNGEVAHTPLPQEGQGWAQQRWLDAQECDPAGFSWKGRGGPDRSEPPLPELPAAPCPRADILALSASGQSHSTLWTSTTKREWRSLKPPKVAALLPELVLLRKGLWVNQRAIRRVRHDAKNYYVDLTGGLSFRVSQQVKGVPERLGVTSLLWLEPARKQLYGEYALRDWPWDLSRLPGWRLRTLFVTPRQLLGQLIWQRMRYRWQGEVREWAPSYRDFWYEVAAPALHRAQFLNVEELRRAHHPLYALLFEIMDYLVEDSRLFTFREFGFQEPRPDMRSLGQLRPNILLVVEKSSLHESGRRLAQEFGLSLRLLDSQPPLLASEYLAAELQEKVPGPIRVLALVDYDPGGWILGRALAKQLRFFGLPQVSEVEFLVRQECFSDEEKRLFARPVPQSNSIMKSKAQRWLAESGGVNGQLLGIHADHLPYERLRQSLLDLLNRDPVDPHNPP